MENKKLTALDIKGQHVEEMATALLDMIEKNDISWTKGWSTCNRAFKNYITNKEYRGGSNLFTLWMSTLFMPMVLEQPRSHYYVTSKQAFDLGWKLKKECKSWSKDNEQRREKLTQLREKFETLTDEKEKEELKKQINDLRIEIYKHRIWEEIIYFEFTMFRIITKEVDGETKYFREDLKYIQDDYIVVRTKEVTKDYVDKYHYQIDKVIKSISTRYYTVAPIEFFEGEKKLKNRSLEFKEYDTKKTNEDAWKILNNYFEREQIKVNEERQNEAYYCVTTDSITLPKIEQFENELEAIATTAHEAGHSTGAKNRLNRGLEKTADKSSCYAKEELVAEMTSLFFLIDLGILDDIRLGKALAYLKAYLKHVREDNEQNNLIYGINNAHKAFDFIVNGKSSQEESNEENEREN